MSAPASNSLAAMQHAPSAAPKRPPFRADQVGSLLRPEYVKEAREQRERGEITKEQLRAIEDRAIREVVKLQEEVGLQAITDGEFRRAFWHVDFLSGFDGIEWTHGDYAVSFKGADGKVASTSSMLVVKDKVRRTRPIMVDHFAFLKAATTRTAKFCIPSPTYMHMRGGRKVVDKQAYPDMAEFWADVVAAYRAEIADLRAAGCSYLQLDDVSFATMCDPKVRSQVTEDGEDPASLAVLYTDIINAITKGRDPAHAVTMHTCRGNSMSMWMAEGGYDPVAEVLFNRADVDGFFLEYDTERAGGFEPLRFVPKGKKIVLGLVSSKTPELETKSDLKRRIEAAAKYVALEDLCLSPQCGFASSHHGNKITDEIERRKLALVVEVADEVWGGR
ncbi:5-methyltetrahydropteroyltriglutamate--homocysteine S-methyltransferase [Pseudolabrys sp. FHR47]|uniref:5-methyltetrahydropteroyltriglutamate-- homocysteine S-methyltransferase n=1 Tax=Pseudolabrys sp. FHR47 TaxID=2562284 RepID=UPI001980187B|nr:5-methyltetrahydropteroyltriglutamate--homocysteine S-methyltransferase [Pseudolabrys sp. FHR47]